MQNPPWHGYDLDKAAVDAIGKGSTNAVIGDEFTGAVSLIAAVYLNNRLDLFESLISAGAAMTAEDLMLVIWYTSDLHADQIEFLLKREVPHSAGCLHVATRNENWEIVLLLLKYGVDTHTLIDPERKVTPLHAAAWAGKAAVAECLLQQGVEVDSRDIDEMTPLMRVCDVHALHRKGIYPTLDCLLRHGADPNAMTPSGKTALLLCFGEPKKRSVKRSVNRFAKRTDIAQLLLRYGANPNVISAAGTTPLMLAARDNDVALTSILLQANADVGIRTPAGKSAIDAAEERNNREVLALLTG